MTLLVVDSSALLAILFQETQSEACARCLVGASRVLISAANALECALKLGGDPAYDRSAELDPFLNRIGIEVREVDLAQYRAARAAHLAYGRGRHPARLNFGDCFAYALAKTLDAPLLFVGDDFSRTDIACAL